MFVLIIISFIIEQKSLLIKYENERKLQEKAEKSSSRNQLDLLKEEVKLKKIDADSDKLAMAHAQKMELNEQRSQLSLLAHGSKMTISSNAKVNTKLEMNNVNQQKYSMYATNFGMGSGGMQGMICCTNNSLFCASV